MNKTELINKVVESTRIPKSNVIKIADKLIDTIRDQIISGSTVKIRKLGTFKSLKKKARKGVNPRTNEPIEIPSIIAIKFVPAKKLVAELNK